MIQKLIDAYELEREMYCKCIDTDEEIEKGRAKWDSGLWIRYKVFEEAITLAPRVDEVKHGHWIISFDNFKNGKDHYKCSECGYLQEANNFSSEYKYCTHCGAKMDEVI